MGLDVSFYASADLAHASHDDGPDDDCWDEHTVLYVHPDFSERADGLSDRSCWSPNGSTHLSHSYSGYSRYRAWLCMAAIGVEPEVVWAEPEDYSACPFYEQVHFADNEGTIGPVTAAKLAKDYREQREGVVWRMKGMPKPFDLPQSEHDRIVIEMVKHYDLWAAGFASVGETGLVIFS